MPARASIQRHLLLLVMAAVAAVWTGTAVLVYLDARHEINEVLDAHLAQAAGFLNALSRHDMGEIETEQVPGLHKRARRVAFQIWQGDRLLLHSANAPAQPLARQDAGYSDGIMDGRRWRVFSSRAGEFVVHVGERTQAREELAREMVVGLLMPLLYALPLLALLLWLAVGRGLRPLANMTRQISARAPDNLAALDVAAAPAEIAPLVEQLNQLFRRIERSIESERRFTADAAHELRTPVAAIKAQAQVALGAGVDRERERALTNVMAGCDRAAHLVDQLLVLARLDRTAESGAERCLMRVIAVQAISDVASYAAGKGVEFELKEGAEAELQGFPALLHVMLRNLLDNAVRYSPRGTVVRIAVSATDQAVSVSVTDEGPGIAESERERVFERFYRVLGTPEAGTGLGLSIVQRIAEIHGARIELGSGDGGRGLCVTVTFPRRHMAL
ncbi:MAG TPA: ATP-binding protein [Burkholderiales bacterium]|nr:ATP-binding protein [Burkholderiales bacterium]